MYLAYLDESGDPGLVRSPTDWFVLSCLMVHERDWLACLDEIIKLRRRLRDNVGIPTRVELKAAHFRAGKGALRKHTPSLDVTGRMRLFRGLLTYQARLPISVFAVAIHKARQAARDAQRGPEYTSRFRAWQMTLQRIHTHCSKTNERAMLFPDEGHGYYIRALMRRFRRHHTVPAFFDRENVGQREIPLNLIIEDPNDRSSSHSYFGQLADWNAYAAHKSKYVAPNAPIPDDSWDQLGRVLNRDVNKLTGGAPGLVIWPR